MKRQDDHNMVGSKKQSIENRVDLNVFHPRYKVVHCNYHEKEGARVQNIVTIIIMCWPVPPAASPVKPCKIILREIISVTQEVSCFHNILLGCKLGIAPHFTNCRFTVVNFIFANVNIWETDPCHDISHCHSFV